MKIKNTYNVDNNNIRQQNTFFDNSNIRQQNKILQNFTINN
jgi:hypothetical protein